MADPGEQGLGGMPAEPDPRTKLMEEVAAQMDAIEADFGDGYQIGHVVTVVEVQQPDGTVSIRVRSTQQPWISAGMLRFALRILEADDGQ